MHPELFARLNSLRLIELRRRPRIEAELHALARPTSGLSTLAWSTLTRSIFTRSILAGSILARPIPGRSTGKAAERQTAPGANRPCCFPVAS
jgi:hypothetical protein